MLKLAQHAPMTDTGDLETYAWAICAKKNFAYAGRLARGTFKETFRVRSASGRHYALKIVKPGSQPDRLYREIAAMRRCDHPNITRLAALDVFEAGAIPVLYVLEHFLAGGTLAQRLRRQGSLPLGEVIGYARRLSSAIAYLADLNLVHRDLKPDNIMFGEDASQPIIVDFGLVRDLDSPSLTLTRLAHGPGSPLYASPEQANNIKEEIDWRSDQFALGIVLAYCAFGIHPFAERDDDNRAIATKIACEPEQSPRFLAAARSSGLTPLIRMTAPAPAKRYTQPEELVAAWAEMR